MKDKTRRWWIPVIKDINLNSSEWCDIIFDGRKNSYGAYNMRRNSSMRHIYAFIILLVVFSLIAFIPRLIENVGIYKDYEKIIEISRLSDLQFEDDNDYILPDAPIPEPLVPSFMPTAELPPTPIEALKSNKIEIVNEIPPLEALLSRPLEDITKDMSSEEKEKEATNLDEEGETYKVEELFTVVDDMPAFPGGEPALRDFIAKNLKYPIEAVNKKIQGSVICTFIIEKDGSVTNVKIAQPANALLNQEVMRVINILPKWKPGKKNGKIIRVKYTLPLIFSLQ